LDEGRAEGREQAWRHIEAFAGGGKEAPPPAGCPTVICERPSHHLPVFGIDVHGSFGGSGAPFCRSSIECLSGERTNAIVPSRGGRLMVTPAFISLSHSP